MIKVNCGSCQACCKWNGTVRIIPQHPLIRMDKETGNCIHLREEGCSLFRTSDRPDVCKNFSCVTLVEDMRKDTFMAVLMEGLKRMK